MKNYRAPQDIVITEKCLVPLVGYGGYYVDRWNDVYSFQMAEGAVIKPWDTPQSPGRLRLTLFGDTGGKKHRVSREKILVQSYGLAVVRREYVSYPGYMIERAIKRHGKWEFDQREKSRDNRLAIEAKENAARDMLAKQRQGESEKKFTKEYAEYVENLAKDGRIRAEEKRRQDETFFADLARLEQKQRLEGND